ncbi:MAG: (2Fe-2S)-binding protein [Burkholderiales bacterium]|nr:(2Fe-2S)-binding protein [Burkholderiales bacterium]
MIVCVCNNVSDKKIQRAVESGMTTMSELREHLDVGTCCGKCAGCARKVLRTCVDNQSGEHNGLQTLLHRLHFSATPVAA